MTIASAFNEIAVAQGGTADNSGTIAGAVDALTDALAGSDVAQGATIEDGVRVLGEYIGGGGGSIGSVIYGAFDKSAAAPIVGGAEPEESFDIGSTLFDANDVVFEVDGGRIIQARAGFYIQCAPNAVPDKLFAIAIGDDDLISKVEELPVNTRTLAGAPFVLLQLPDNSIGADALVFMVGLS